MALGRLGIKQPTSLLASIGIAWYYRSFAAKDRDFRI